MSGKKNQNQDPDKNWHTFLPLLILINKKKNDNNKMYLTKTTTEMYEKIHKIF